LRMSPAVASDSSDGDIGAIGGIIWHAPSGDADLEHHASHFFDQFFRQALSSSLIPATLPSVS
jgi:hypothetical protein